MPDIDLLSVQELYTLKAAQQNHGDQMKQGVIKREEVWTWKSSVVEMVQITSSLQGPQIGQFSNRNVEDVHQRYICRDGAR